MRFQNYENDYSHFKHRTFVEQNDPPPPLPWIHTYLYTEHIYNELKKIHVHYLPLLITKMIKLLKCVICFKPKYSKEHFWLVKHKKIMQEGGTPLGNLVHVHMYTCTCKYLRGSSLLFSDPSLDSRRRSKVILK